MSRRFQATASRPALIALGLLLLAGCRPYEPHGTLIEPPLETADFTLVSARGEVGKADLDGKIGVMFFGFRHCPDICPDTMARLSRAVGELSDEQGEQVQVVLVSVDPERDPPEEIQAYAEAFHPSFLGLSGSPEQIREVASEYGIFYEEVPFGDSYTVDHTPAAIVLDRNGDMVLIWSYGIEADQMAADLRYLIRQ